MATGYTAHRTARPPSGRLRMGFGLAFLAELVVFIAVASWIGFGWTVLATLATSALGALLLARQGTKALGELRQRAQERRAPGRALGDAGLIALGGLLMVLPGFLGDLLGLLCLLPLTRPLPRALIARGLIGRLPDAMRGPVRVVSVRTETTAGPAEPFRAGPATRVIEGQVADGEVDPGPRA